MLLGCSTFRFETATFGHEVGLQELLLRGQNGLGIQCGTSTLWLFGSNPPRQANHRCYGWWGVSESELQKPQFLDKTEITHLQHISLYHVMLLVYNDVSIRFILRGLELSFEE